MPQLTFFVGKGGVGKTTVSSAYAAWAARKAPRRKILLLSTDPAHSLADLLETKLSNKSKRLPAVGRLYARQIDAEVEVKRFLVEQREGILGVVESGTFFTREEIEPLLDATLPGMSEVAALVALHELLQSGEFDEIVVDTAPMGHTLRLFEMPQHFAKFLAFLETASSRDAVLASRFGGSGVAPNSFVKRWSAMLERVRSALSKEGSRVVLVTTPEPFALAESVRAQEWLRGGGSELEISEVVVNRAVSAPVTCDRCKARERATRKAVARLRKEVPGCGVSIGEDPGFPILGSESLAAFGAHVFGGKKLRLRAAAPKKTNVRLAKATWPSVETPLALTVGKGGVGKTTISAALAFHERKQSAREVTVCSVDPAPSLDDVFQTNIDDRAKSVLGDSGLRAAEFDAVAHYKRWAGEMQERISEAMTAESGGIHLDLSFDREVLLALLDIVPPGVDEVFATLRILDLVRAERRVVIDMAPTGHALELLKTPERLLQWTRLLLKTLAAHRTLPLAQDAAVEVATIAQKLRALAKTLQNGRETAVWTVMLAEPLPDRETVRLLDDLAELKINVAGLFVNRILRERTGCARCGRAREWQMVTLAEIRKRFVKTPVFVLGEVKGGVAGKRALQSFTKELWQMQS